MKITDTEPKRTLLTQLSQYQKLLDEIQDVSLFGEINEERELELINMQKDIAVKVDSIAYVMGELESSAERLRNQAKEFNEVAEFRESAVQRLKGYLQHMIKAHGEEKIQGIWYEFYLKRGNPAVVIEDEKAIPDEYKIVKTTVSVDKVAIKKAMQEFKSVPGASLKETKTVIKKVKS
jgi:hypothetical protein